MPRCSQILSLLYSCHYISTVDAASLFYQLLVKREHRYKSTVGSHKRPANLWLYIDIYCNSPIYAQYVMDRVLRQHLHCARANIHDIVIFSKTLQEHLAYLKEVFSQFLHFHICLNPKISVLEYPSVQLLGQQVYVFGLTSDDDKLAAIARIVFPRTFRPLDHCLGLTGHMREYITYHGPVSTPLQEGSARLYRTLQERRIVSNTRKKEAPRMRILDPMSREFKAFYIRQKLFTMPLILT